MKDGTIVVGVFYNNLYDADGRYKPKDPKPSSQSVERWPSRIGCLHHHLERRRAHLVKPNYIDTKGMPFTNLEGPTDAPIEMPDGSILMGAIAYGLNGDATDVASVLIRSTDKGKSWKYVSTIADDPGGKLGGFVEPGIVRTKTGRIVAGLRNHGPDNAIWTTYSDDDGKTWAPVKKTDMIGHPVDLIQLSDGRLMASYGVRTQHAPPRGRAGLLQQRQRRDVGHSNRSPNSGTISATGTSDIRSRSNCADGRVLTVYYGNLFGKYFIGGTFWKP